MDELKREQFMVLNHVDPEDKEAVLNELFRIEPDRFMRFKKLVYNLEERLKGTGKELSEEETEDMEGMFNWLAFASNIAEDIYGLDVFVCEELGA